MKFVDYGTKFLELQEKIKNVDFYAENETYETIQRELNDVFVTLMKMSVEQQIFFSASPLKIYKIELENRLKEKESQEIDFHQIQYLKDLYNHHYELLSSDKQTYRKDPYRYIPHLDNENFKLFRSIIRKRIDFLENLLFSKGIKVQLEQPFPEAQRLRPKFIKIGLPLQTQETNPIQNTKKTKTNKSLLFNGSPLNLSERFKIANEVLNIDRKIRSLNISDDEKYQLLAYILGCDKTNARHLMNGKYNSNDRELTNYFDDLGLNK